MAKRVMEKHVGDISAPAALAVGKTLIGISRGLNSNVQVDDSIGPRSTADSDTSAPSLLVARVGALLSIFGERNPRIC